MCGGGAWDEEGGGRPVIDLAVDLVSAARRAATLAGGDSETPLLREAAEVSVFPGVPLS